MRALRTAGFLAFLILGLGTALTGCKTREGREGAMTDPAVVYQRAKKAMAGGFGGVFELKSLPAA